MWFNMCEIRNISSCYIKQIKLLYIICEREDLEMYTELIVGKETFKLNEDGKNLHKSLEFSGLANQVPIFIYLVKNIETHFVSMKMYTEEQLELQNIMDEIEGGFMPFETNEELEEFSRHYSEKMDIVGNDEIRDLGGVGLKIHGDKYILEYFFDGICPSEKIYLKDGTLLSEVSRSRIYISLLNEEKLCDFSIEKLNPDDLGLMSGNDIEEFIKVNLNEETLPSVGVVYNEFKENNALARAFKKIYSTAYTEKNNALRNVVSHVVEEDGRVTFLMGMTQGNIDAGMALHPDKLFIYSV